MLKHEKVVRLFVKPPSLPCSNQIIHSNAPVLARFQGGVKLNSDIRIAVGFLDHPKTIKLRRRLGWEGFESLLRLWFWAAQYRPDGVFNDMTDEDIEIAAQWSNDRSTFVTTLVELRLLDVENNVYSLHKWVDRNGYAASANDRSDKSRFARMARTYPAIYQELKGKGVDSISAEDYRRLTTVQRPLNETLTERTSPLPSPSPLPSNNPPIVPPKGDGIPYEEIVKHLSVKSGKAFKETSQETRKQIRARWKEGFRLKDFISVIDNMTAEWKGDPERDQYLRPTTLFRASKFEGYLNRMKPEKVNGSRGVVY